MNQNFKLVILDYPIAHLDHPSTKKALNDVIINKQKNFARTDENYVVMDKHDMIGTHYLIYDVSEMYEPKLILAIRTTFEDRAQQHYLKTPIQELIPKLQAESQEHYQKFKDEKKCLADCNSWFVDLNYTQKNSGLNLSDIGYAMVYAHVTRMGFDHILGCTNEKYKASRWLENIGYFDKSHVFVHPVVPDPHMFIIVEKFNKSYLNSIYQQYSSLFDNLQELVPANFKGVKWDEARTVFHDTPTELKFPKAGQAA